jgi:hypothetical protein
MQGGIRSRVMATAAAEMIEEKIGDFQELKSWVRLLRRGEVSAPTWTTAEQESEWKRFLARFEHRDNRQRAAKSIKLRATWNRGVQPKDKAPVRVIRIGDSSEAVIANVSSSPLGRMDTSWVVWVVGGPCFQSRRTADEPQARDFGRRLGSDQAPVARPTRTARRGRVGQPPVHRCGSVDRPHWGRVGRSSGTPGQR